MGHQVDHLGRFAVDPPMSEELRAWIDVELLDDPWEAAAARDLPLELDTYCTWWTGGTASDGTVLEWTGAEKSYDGTAWLAWLVEHVLTPAGHTVEGDVFRFAEPGPGYVEASIIHSHPPGSQLEGLRETTVVDTDDGRLPVPDDAPSIGDAFFLLTDGDGVAGQQLLETWLAVTPLGDHPLVSFLEDVARFFPDPEGLHTAIAAGPQRAAPRRRGLLRRRRG